jgi:hypothetical protein
MRNYRAHPCCISLASSCLNRSLVQIRVTRKKELIALYPFDTVDEATLMYFGEEVKRWRPGYLVMQN